VSIPHRTTILAASVIAALLMAAPALAHVELTPRLITAGSPARLTLTVPNEESTAATTKVVVKLPTNVAVLRFDSKRGWSRSVTIRRLPKPMRVAGRTIRSRVAIVTWTATTARARIGPGSVAGAFRFTAVAWPSGTRVLVFPTVQTYTNGEAVHWIGPPGSDEPAARVVLGSG
jgi:periplasmic copper chaperone A